MKNIFIGSKRSVNPKQDKFVKNNAQAYHHSQTAESQRSGWRNAESTQKTETLRPGEL